MIFRRLPIGTLAYMGGVPCNLEAFTWSWGQIIQNVNENLCRPVQDALGTVIPFVHLDRAVTSEHRFARNGLAKTFMGDWLVMLDMDHANDPDVVSRMVGMVKHYDIDVLSAFYRDKHPPHCPQIWFMDPETKIYAAVAEIDMNAELWGGEELCAGAGCLLIRRTVFERIENELHEEPFDNIPRPGDGKPWGEDFSFFYRCYRLGIKSYVCPQIKTHHLRIARVTDADYDSSAVDTIQIPTGGQAVVK